MTPEKRKKILLDSLQTTIGVLMDDVRELREAVPKSRNLAEEAIEFCDGVQEVLSWDMKRRLTAIMGRDG